MEVARVRPDRSKKEKEKMTQFERFVTEGSEKADELAKAGTMMDEGFTAETRPGTMEQKRRGVRSLATCGSQPLFGEGMERL